MIRGMLFLPWKDILLLRLRRRLLWPARPGSGGAVLGGLRRRTHELGLDRGHAQSPGVRVGAPGVRVGARRAARLRCRPRPRPRPRPAGAALLSSPAPAGLGDCTPNPGPRRELRPRTGPCEDREANLCRVGRRRGLRPVPASVCAESAPGMESKRVPAMSCQDPLPPWPAEGPPPAP